MKRFDYKFIQLSEFKTLYSLLNFRKSLFYLFMSEMLFYKISLSILCIFWDF